MMTRLGDIVGNNITPIARLSHRVLTILTNYDPTDTTNEIFYRDLAWLAGCSRRNLRRAADTQSSGAIERNTTISAIRLRPISSHE